MAATVAKWTDVKTVGTIAPDYAYGRDAVAAFVEYLKKLRPDIQIVDQQWPKLGEPDFTPFITAQMSKKPDAVMCDVFGGDFVTFAKQAGPLGYFKAINNRLVDGGEVGTVDEAQALGADYPYGIISDTYDPVVWAGGNEPPEHKAYEERLKAGDEIRLRLGLGDPGLYRDRRPGRRDQQGRQRSTATRSRRRCSASASTPRSASARSTRRRTRPWPASSGARWSRIPPIRSR
jgi:hypothetical protein